MEKSIPYITYYIFNSYVLLSSVSQHQLIWALSDIIVTGLNFAVDWALATVVERYKLASVLYKDLFVYLVYRISERLAQTIWEQSVL